MTDTIIQPPTKSRGQRLRNFLRKPHALIPLVTVGVFLVFGLGAYIFAHQTDTLPKANDANIVIVSHDRQQQVVPSDQPTVGALLKELGVVVRRGDVVEPAVNTKIDQDQFRVNVYRAKQITIVDTNQRTAAVSAATSGRTIGRQAGVTIYPEDHVDVGPAQDFLRYGTLGEEVVIDRAMPVNVDLYGTPVVLRTHAETVGGLMKEKNIKLTKDDKLSVPEDTPITPGQSIAFLRTGTNVETVTEPIAAPTQNINDPNLAYGTTAVRQQGAAGEQVVTYQVTRINNVITKKDIIQKVVNRQPVTEIKVVGSSISGIKGDMARAGIAPQDFAAADYIISHESGWRPNAAPRGLSGPYGLCQANPGTKMSSAGSDWQTNPVTQLRWCHGYAQSRYGGWQAAYKYWVSNRHW